GGRRLRRLRRRAHSGLQSQHCKRLVAGGLLFQINSVYGMRATLHQSSQSNIYTSGTPISRLRYKRTSKSSSRIRQSAFVASWPTSKVAIQRSISGLKTLPTGGTGSSARGREAIQTSNGSS